MSAFRKGINQKKAKVIIHQTFGIEQTAGLEMRPVKVYAFLMRVTNYHREIDYDVY